MGFFSAIFAPGEQERGDDLDAKLAEINARDYGPGGKYYTPHIYSQSQRNLETSRTGNIDAEIQEAFGEGVDEGAANIRGTIGGTVNASAKLFKIIPWQVWVIGAVALFLWLGGGAYVLRKSRGVFS